MKESEANFRLGMVFIFSHTTTQLSVCMGMVLCVPESIRHRVRTFMLHVCMCARAPRDTTELILMVTTNRANKHKYKFVLLHIIFSNYNHAHPHFSVAHTQLLRLLRYADTFPVSKGNDRVFPRIVYIRGSREEQSGYIWLCGKQFYTRSDSRSAEMYTSRDISQTLSNIRCMTGVFLHISAV